MDVPTDDDEDKENLNPTIPLVISIEDKENLIPTIPPLISIPSDNDDDTPVKKELSPVKQKDKSVKQETVSKSTPRRLKMSQKWRFVEEDDNSDDSNESAVEGEGMIDANDAVTIFNILLLNPEKYEQRKKPIAIRDYHLCTFDKTILPMNKTRPDDNGSY